MADLIGQQIGSYRIQSPLGAGGMATTYVAVDTRLDNRQVIIEISPIHSDEQLQRKEYESRILTRFDHPNILRTIEFGEESDMFYIVNEYIPEGTLSQRHPRGTRIPLSTVVSYVKQVASALQYAHDRGIVHRDVKPENMLITSDGRVLLSDFGIATTLPDKALDAQTGVAGTPKYMAPEQWRGKIERASDQYALGIVVYEWLSGEVPFSGTALELMQKQLIHPPPPLSALVPEIPHAVEAVVMRALSKNSVDRYPSVQEFADALEQASKPPLATLPTVASTPIEVLRNGSQNADKLSLLPSDTPDTHPSVPSIMRSSRPRLSSIFRYAGQALTKFFAGRRENKRRDVQPLLCAMARMTLEEDDRAIVGKIYTVQAGLSRPEGEEFRGAPFKVSTEDPAQPIVFHVLFHASWNIELMDAFYQPLSYDPANAEPQFIDCSFRLNAPGECHMDINFDRKLNWLRTIHFEFVGIEQARPSATVGGR